MQSEIATAPLGANASAARRTSGVLLVLAAVALAGNCLLNNPGRFSQAHEEDRSLLRPIVSALAMGGAFPTVRGVEIRDLIFYFGAALISLVAGVALLTAKGSPRFALDDLLDFRQRANSPVFWWLVLLLVSGFSSVFSHAPEVCKGQTIIRLFHLGWWLPLAMLLTPRHARKLTIALLVILTVTAMLGVWYQIVRQQPRLQYPMGNELFVAACLLPGVFLATGLGGGWLSGRIWGIRSPSEGLGKREDDGKPSPWVAGLAVVSVLSILAAIWFTRSRSAGIGLAAGLLAVLLLLGGKQARPWVLLIGVVLAIGGALYVQHLRVAGAAGERAHSIRARLDHEWPYALALFYRKPITGQGDGAYAMLAGQFAREEQLDDPAILSFEEWSWVGHAHNEFLELLADLGAVGMLAFALAIVLTVLRGLRFCDRTRSDPERWKDRWLVVGLTAALVAVVFEECSNVALRTPGLSPIFLAVWAALFALTRERQPAGVSEPEGSRPLGLSAIRLSGLAVCVVAAVMAYWATQDWRAARAYHDCREFMSAGLTDQAVAKADFAERHTLSAVERLGRRMHSVWARSLRFDAVLASSDAPPADADFEEARQALIRLEELKRASPRFLRTARLEADLSLNLSRAHERRDESTYAQNYRERFLRALEQHRADEPFRFDVVAHLWQAKPGASAVDRLLWLRCLLRNGEMDAGFLALFDELASRDDFQSAMADLMNLALQDAARPADRWGDRLSPETVRIAALDYAVGDRLEDAAKWAWQAAAMYQRAGPRLFAGHSAALHEMVRYRFGADPASSAEENLERLAEAQTVFAAPAGATTPLPGGLGQTRLRVLLAADRDGEAALQARLLADEDEAAADEAMIRGLLAISAQFAARPSQSERVLRWLGRVDEISPGRPESRVLRLAVHLRRADDEAALAAAEGYLECEKDRAVAFDHLARLEERYAGSAVWSELRRRYPDFRPSAGAEESPASMPTPTTEPTALP